MIYIIILAIVLLYIIFTYNKLIILRNRVKNAWAQVLVQLKRRADLIPNLVETVKGYAAHEKTVFENVTKARTQFLSATTPTEQMEASNALTGVLRTLFAVAENYPQLKANENFLRLQEDLTDTENKIAFSREFYNDTVLKYNNTIQVFPANIIAGIFGFSSEHLYEIPEEDKGSVKVQF